MTKHFYFIFEGENVVFPEEMKENLQKLKALSRDDLTESAMLRSRIDQQAELICILKQRADESLRKTRTLETELVDLKTSRQDTVELLENEMRKYSVLEKRFTVLNSNHEEMIILKDEYKEQNKKLLKENNLLRKENREMFAKALQEQDEEIRKLREQVECLKEQLTSSSRDQRLVATTSDEWLSGGVLIIAWYCVGLSERFLIWGSTTFFYFCTNKQNFK